MSKFTFKSTVRACYVGNFVQATVINITPILFIPLKEQFGISYAQLGVLVLINFLVQVSADLIFSALVDRYGFRRFVVWGHGCTAIGLVMFALVPFIMPFAPYVGFVAATVLFSAGGGLLELLLSPIVNAIPTDDKVTAMSVLHSFYAWGQLTVVLVTTGFIFLLGREWWPLIVLVWAVPAIFNVYLFSRVPLGSPVPEHGEKTGVFNLLRTPFFLVILMTIMMGGASEVSINQWTSAFMEKTLNLPKVIGDVAGMSLFAAMLGLGRLLYGFFGSKVSVRRVMTIGAATAFFCYIIVALVDIPVIALIACGISGLAVSLLWPGSLVIATERFPLAGASMFAIMAAGGDVGASVGPAIVGAVADYAARVPFLKSIGDALALTAEQLGLRSGMLFGAIFPLCTLITLLWIARRQRNEIIKPRI